MRKRILALVLILALLLTGCSWMDGSYVYVEPHVEHQSGAQTGNVSAADFFELRAVLEELVTAGTETCTIDVGDMEQDRVEGFVKAGFRPGIERKQMWVSLLFSTREKCHY